MPDILIFKSKINDLESNFSKTIPEKQREYIYSLCKGMTEETFISTVNRILDMEVFPKNIAIALKTEQTQNYNQCIFVDDPCPPATEPMPCFANRFRTSEYCSQHLFKIDGEWEEILKLRTLMKSNGKER